MKIPPNDEARRVLDIRTRGKSGRSSTIEEMKFCRKMLKKYPVWYSSLDAEVFNRTVPFGSSVKFEDNHVWNGKDWVLKE